MAGDEMRTELRELARVQMGYSFRTRLELMEPGEIAVLQMRDLTDENRVDCSGLLRIEMEKLKEHHLVKPGDLVFRSRGQVSTSAILTEDPGKAVVAAPLLRIRVNSQSVLPEYLHWFINQPTAQAFLASRAKGTAQKMISKQALESLEVCVPPLDRQRTIVELAVLVEEEQNLMNRLAGKRRQYVSTIMMQLVEGE
ncbi:MAG: restriction endonuclease subunit S [Candidatus Desulforudis sp.]|nr:restriction endonuclease subunit S [Desulforudis sp.]